MPIGYGGRYKPVSPYLQKKTPHQEIFPASSASVPPILPCVGPKHLFPTHPDHVSRNNSTSQSSYVALAANSTSNSSAPAGGPAGGVLETVATLTNDTTTTIISTATPTPVPSSTSMASSSGTSIGGVSVGPTTTSGGTGTPTGSAAASTSSGAAVGVRMERWMWGVIGVMGWEWMTEW